MFLQNPLHLLTGLKTQFRVFPRTNCTLLFRLVCITGHKKSRLPGHPLLLFLTSLQALHLPHAISIFQSQDPQTTRPLQGALCPLDSQSFSSSLISSASSLNVSSTWGPSQGHCSPATLPDGSNVSPSSSGPRDGVPVLLDPSTASIPFSLAKTLSFFSQAVTHRLLPLPDYTCSFWIPLASGLGSLSPALFLPLSLVISCTGKCEHKWNIQHVLLGT